VTPVRVLFVCIHNSARSQMAEALLNHLAGDRFHAESAGLEPGKLNPLAVEALREIGIDISGKQTRDVFEVYRTGSLFDYVVTVCDETNGERCPYVPGVTTRLHWNFEDPGSFTGTHAERLQRTIAVRDQIRAQLEAFVSAPPSGPHSH
jgi:arsenate reductase (thioredoxin)